MTRQEEIEQAAIDFCHKNDEELELIYCERDAFVAGAKWADQHLQDMPQWVSVDDELPTETGLYIAVQGNVVCSMWFYANCDEWADIYVDEAGNVQSRPMTGITHWMPLPLPPEKLSNVERNGKNWKISKRKSKGVLKEMFENYKQKGGEQ